MVLRLQCSFGADTAFVRDRVAINPHFTLPGITADADALCSDLATALRTWCASTREVEVKSYDAQGTPPVAPNGRAIVDTGQTPASDIPREVAICLSYYADFNRPRYRGRLYIPWHVVAGAEAHGRPTSTQRDKVGALAGIFASLGGPDVDWVVYSRADNAPRRVTNWWVDDEWDTVRSRGLRATTRTVGTTSG